MRINPSVRYGLVIGVNLALATLGNPNLFAGDEPRANLSTSTRAPAADLPVLNFVRPGTLIDNTPPDGWSHLVLKSIPKLASGDLDTLPESAKDTATMFHTVILADVRRQGGEGGEYALRRVGLGICLPDRGHDIVVNSDALQALGIKLSTIPKIVLGSTEREMARGRLLARTPTCAILRSPVLLFVNKEHRRVLLNYALLVDPKSGSLRTLVWWIDEDASARKPLRDLVVLPPAPLVYTCNMDVSAQRILGQIPVSWSFAMGSMPPGQTQSMPARLQAWSVHDPKSDAESLAFERELRSAWNAPRRALGAVSSAAPRPGRRPY
jgi:hypothetical protein